MLWRIRIYEEKLDGICVILALVLTFSLCGTFTLLHRSSGWAEDIRRTFWKIQWNRDTEARSLPVCGSWDSTRNLSASCHAWLTPFTDIRSAKGDWWLWCGFMQINQFYMQTSQNMAKYQGLKTAGKGYWTQVSGEFMSWPWRTIQRGILNITEPASTAVNDKTFDSSKRLGRLCQFSTIRGYLVKVTYEEDGKVCWR